MLQRVFQPTDPRLRSIVNCICVAEMRPQDRPGGSIALFPDATSNLAFSLNGEDLPFNLDCKDTLLGATVCTTQLLHRTQNLRFLSVQFKPFGLYGLAGIPMHELKDTYLTSDILFSASEQAELKDRLLAAPDVETIVRTMEHFLASRVYPERVDERVPFAASMIRDHEGLTMDDWSRAVCLSPRGFRKLFRQQVGVPPTYYKKINRFNRAARHLVEVPDPSLTEVAYRHGYYDQAHFIKDFRALSGITPSQFLHQKARSADFYNFNRRPQPTLEPRG